MNKDLVAIFEYMEQEKGIKREIVIEAIEESLNIAAKKSIQGTANITVNINPKTGNVEVLCEKEIVEDLTNPNMEILLEEAKDIDPDCELGQFIDVTLPPKDFGRIAAQKARQIIMQKLRGAERDVIYEEYRHRLGELISGTVKRRLHGADLLIDLGKVEALMPARHYPKTEKYQTGERVMALLFEVQETENGGADVILTRTDPTFVEQLFIQEVPELADETIKITNIVREPGYRTKVVVRSNDNKVDPVGACVGMRGTRIKNVIRELNNEKIDVIPHASDPVDLLQNALDPIEIHKVRVNEENNTLSIVIDDDDFAVVIGRRGMNARLNGRLINVNLEVQKISDYKMASEIYRNELAESDDPYLDEPLQLEGVNKLVLENLIDAGFDTPRKLLSCDIHDLEAVPGVSSDFTEELTNQIRKERK